MSRRAGIVVIPTVAVEKWPPRRRRTAAIVTAVIVATQSIRVLSHVICRIVQEYRYGVFFVRRAS
jgi:hypothetical protein